MRQDWVSRATGPDAPDLNDPPVSPEAASPLGGRCIEIDARTVTRDSLIAQGVKPEAADELIAYANALLARHGLERYARHADACAWRRNDPAGCTCGLAKMETTIDARATTPPSPYTIHA